MEDSSSSTLSYNQKNTDKNVNQSFENSISESNIPNFDKILVTHDGKEQSNDAINHAISISNMSKAEIVLLRVLEDTDLIKNTIKESGETGIFASSVSSPKESSTALSSPSSEVIKSSEIKIPQSYVEKMEEMITKIRDLGYKNKITYKFILGDKVSGLTDEINNGNYDLVVTTSTHLNSWINSLFSDTRKLLSNVNKSVLVV